MPGTFNLKSIFKLDQPYPINLSITDRRRSCIAIGCFVFMFLYIFKPFGLNRISDQIFFVSLGYGVVCSSILVVLNMGVFSGFPNFFKEDVWTTKRELLWTMLTVALIGLGNFFYSILIGIAPFSFEYLIQFESYTLAIGVFPITLTILLNQVRLKSKFENESQKINTFIEETKESIEVTGADSSLVTILSESGTDELKIAAHDILYIKAADNYIEIFYLKESNVIRKLIRNSLKNIAINLAFDNTFLRCHKSYIINLQKVDHVTGNAQGYKLHVPGADELVPVSRSNNETVKKYFADHP